jgi:hypothetical protein
MSIVLLPLRPLLPKKLFYSDSLTIYMDFLCTASSFSFSSLRVAIHSWIGTPRPLAYNFCNFPSDRPTSGNIDSSFTGKAWSGSKFEGLRLTCVSGMGKGGWWRMVYCLDASVGMASWEVHGVSICLSGGLEEASSLEGKKEWLKKLKVVMKTALYCTNIPQLEWHKLI